ncbi:MAG: lipopolysaccharide heptosyltransferase II [Candidatus Omnitrophica bacterium]|nr:lipopolysaccharide heptosyltransferase II [Candidatus Omnitrophota bacterium]MDD5552404.1 lipopolysaccharide heptosyltransferase II [Candidatus Omnitrophota bacterium]
MKNKTLGRILIFNVNWLGDVLFSTAVIRNIRRNYPESFIACVIPSRCYPILKDNPHLDEVIIFDEKERQKGTLAKFKFVQMLKSRKFDAVFLLHRSFTRALLCRLAGIPERIGYYTKKRGFLLTRSISPVALDTQHRIDYYLNIIEKAGLRVEDRYPEFFTDEKDARFVDDFLKKYLSGKKALLMAINPGGNWQPKRWPPENWAALGDKLIGELGAEVIITGSQTDTVIARKITGLMKHKPVIAGGVFNLKQLGALCKRADLFITADTGPLHIANAVGAKRIIALFGPTSPMVTGPYPPANAVILSKDVGCKIPCYVMGCKDNRCMKAITPEEVMERVKRVLR